MSHSYSKNYVHAIYSTKDRQNLIPPEFEKRLYSFIASIAREHEIPLLAAGGMPNHSHLLFLLPAAISLASAINTFKANSSRFMHERSLVFEWQNGYGPSAWVFRNSTRSRPMFVVSRAPQEDDLRGGVPGAIEKG
jgi:putative transposase